MWAKRIMLAAVLLLVLAASVAAQEWGGDRGDRAGRDRGGQDRGNRMPMMGGMGGQTPVIAVGTHSLYVFINGEVKRLDKKTLKVLAEKNLTEEEEEGKDAFDMMDKDGNGTLSPDEMPLPGAFFERTDQNGDGVISREEVPERILDMFTGRTMRRIFGGPATLTVDKNDAALFVYYSGILYRLNGKTLSVEAKLQLVDLAAALQRGGGDRGGRDRGRRDGGDGGAPEDFVPPVF